MDSPLSVRIFISSSALTFLTGTCAFPQSFTNYPWVYFLTNDEAAISRYIGPDGPVEFPSQIDGKPVRLITGEVISNIPTSVFGTTGSSQQTWRPIASIQMPDSVTSIGPYAFTYTQLTNVFVGKNVTNIGTRAFFGCTQLESAVIPAGIQTIGDWAFGRYLKLKSVLFLGPPPTSADSMFSTTSSTKPTVYFLSGSDQWGAIFAGRPTSLFRPEIVQQALSSNGSFSFFWSGSGTIPLNVQRATSLDGPWTVVATNNVTGDFTDTNAPMGKAFYRTSLP